MMLAKLHPIVWAFAGGCLSGAALIGFWPDAAGTAPKSDAAARDVVQYPALPPSTSTNDGAAEHAAVPESERPAAAEAAEAPEPSPEPGSSVADILASLEVAYRQSLAPAAAPSPPAASAPPAVAQTAVAQPAATQPAATQPAVAQAAVAQPAVAQPIAASPPVAESGPQRVARAEAPPRDVFLGEVHQNTNVGTVNQNTGNVHQGDVYVIQDGFSYVPYLAYPPGYAVPAYGSRRSKPRYVVPDVQLPSSLGTQYGPSPFKYPVDLVH